MSRFDGDEVLMDAENDRTAWLDVDVGSVAIDGSLQNAMKEFHVFFGCNAKAELMPEICGG